MGLMGMVSLPPMATEQSGGSLEVPVIRGGSGEECWGCPAVSGVGTVPGKGNEAVRARLLGRRGRRSEGYLKDCKSEVKCVGTVVVPWLLGWGGGLVWGSEREVQE